jgi:hypothetical protein
MPDTKTLTTHIATINRALDFFAASRPIEAHGLVGAPAPLGALDGTNFTAETGLMKFAFNDQKLADDPNVIKKVEDAKYYLKGMMSLVTAKLFSDNKNNVAAAFIIPPSQVKDIAVHLPLLSGFASGEWSQTQSLTNVQLSTDFAKFVLDVSLDDYPKAIADGVSAFLQNTGKEIQANAKANIQSYNVTVFSGVISITKVGGIIDIEPAFRIAGTSISVSDVQVAIKNCVSATSFNLNFKAQSFTAPFDYDALRDSDTKAAMDKLITKGAVEQIGSSKSYFGV